MKTIAKIGLGFLLGMLATYVYMSRNKVPEKQEAVLEIVEQPSDTLTPEPAHDPDKHYFTIQMKNKEVELYVGMPKDEVRRVLGKPKSTDIMTVAGRVLETWRYSYKYTSVDFRDGKLEGVNQI